MSDYVGFRHKPSYECRVGIIEDRILSVECRVGIIECRIMSVRHFFHVECRIMSVRHFFHVGMSDYVRIMSDYVDSTFS